jgi:hypothetical protein
LLAPTTRKLGVIGIHSGFVQQQARRVRATAEEAESTKLRFVRPAALISWVDARDEIVHDLGQSHVGASLE